MSLAGKLKLNSLTVFSPDNISYYESEKQAFKHTCKSTEQIIPFAHLCGPPKKAKGRQFFVLVKCNIFILED